MQLVRLKSGEKKRQEFCVSYKHMPKVVKMMYYSGWGTLFECDIGLDLNDHTTEPRGPGLIILGQ